MTTKRASATCDSVLDKCVVAVAECRIAKDERNKEVELCRLGLTQAREYGGLMTEKVIERDDQLSAWYRNPFVVGVIGVLIGGIATGYALKK